MADTYFEFYSDLVYLDSFNGEWITESGGSTPAIKVGGVWKETTSQKIKVGGAWKEIVGCKILVGGVWRVWPPTIAPSAGEENWMYFDFDPFTMTTEDNFLIIEVFS